MTFEMIEAGFHRRGFKTHCIKFDEYFVLSASEDGEDATVVLAATPAGALPQQESDPVHISICAGLGQATIAILHFPNVPAFFAAWKDLSPLGAQT